MNTESPRIRTLLAGGAALLVFGITIPATASSGGAPGTPEVPGKPAVGSVGQANVKADPKGQSIDNPTGDDNNGFRCDDNGGAGAGNPALGNCPSDGYTDPTSPPADTGDVPTTGEGDAPSGDDSWTNT